MTWLPGASTGEVWHITLDNGRQIVVKPCTNPALEAAQRTYLARKSSLPLPAIIAELKTFLILEYVPHIGKLERKGELHAADLIASLHTIHADHYGFASDTMIGTIKQQGGWHDTWSDFLIQKRLMMAARLAYHKAGIDHATLMRLNRLKEKVPDLTPAQHQPSLLHGDLWAGNILGNGDHVAAFIDPAISYGEPEFELAYATFFHSFSQHFFDRYHEHHPALDGFDDTRKPIYQLYPLLLHAALYRGDYGRIAGRILRYFVG